MQIVCKQKLISLLYRNPLHIPTDICGTIDDRIRFQVLHALKQKTKPSSMRAKQQKTFAESKSPLLTALLRQEEAEDAADGPPLVTEDTDRLNEFFADGPSSSKNINELPSITRGAWPWLAAVYVNNITSLSYQCGGTLISARIVISAAHCFQLFKQRYTANEVLVFLGRHNLKNWSEEGSLAAPVDDIFIHPDYNRHLNSYDADIAVVVLKNEVR